MRMHKSPPAVGSVDINQKGKYLLNSQTVNDSQTRSSYQFDGDNDYVTAGTIGSMSSGTVSVRYRINRINTADAYNFILTDTAGQSQLEFVIDTDVGGTPRFEFLAGNNILALTGSANTDALALGEWIHVLATFDNRVTNGSKVYLNGILVA